METTHGSARFATEGEMQAAGMLHGWTTPGALWIGGYDNQPVFYNGDLHQLIVAGTGGGKFTMALAPQLLGPVHLQSQFADIWPGATVVIDPKGEIASLVGTTRGYAYASNNGGLFLLDPWDVCGTGQTSVLDFIAELSDSNPNLIDDARALADAVIIPSGSANLHWDSTARNFTTSLLLWIALSEDEYQSRHIMRLRELITQPENKMNALLIKMSKSPLASGVIARGATSIMNREAKERSGIISSIEQDTNWMDSPQMQRVLVSEDYFDDIPLEFFSQTPCHAYVVIPPKFFMTHRGWLRLVVTSFSNAFKRYPSLSKHPLQKRRHIIIDEFPSLGEMSGVLNDLAVSRGYGIQYHLIAQSLSQLKDTYLNAWESIIANSFVKAFAIGDYFTADYLSRMMGSQTVSTINTSSSLNMQGADKYTQSESVSRTLSGRSLMTPDEILSLPGYSAIVLIRGIRPLNLAREPYFAWFRPPKYSLKDLMDTADKPFPRDDAARAPFEGENKWSFARPKPSSSASAKSPLPKSGFWQKFKSEMGWR